MRSILHSVAVCGVLGLSAAYRRRGGGADRCGGRGSAHSGWRSRRFCMN